MEVPMIAKFGPTCFQSVLPEQQAFKCLPVFNVSIACES
jgi:hypothetical protein